MQVISQSGDWECAGLGLPCQGSEETWVLPPDLVAPELSDADEGKNTRKIKI